MFKIGEFSKLSSVSIRMLRYYDEKDLLKPAYVDPSSGFRYYLAKQLSTIGKIQKLQGLGFSSSIIRKMLDSEDIKDYFDIREEELKEELKTIQSQGRMLDSIKSALQNEDSMMPYNVVLKTIPKRYVVSLRRHVIDYYQEGKLWDLLEDFSKTHQLKFAKNAYPMAIYHDTVYREKYVDIEVQCTLSQELPVIEDQEFKFYETRERVVASVTFHGSYEKMPMVTKAMAQWIEDNHYEMTGPMFNIFHVSPAVEENPEKYITEACIEIKEREV